MILIFAAGISKYSAKDEYSARFCPSCFRTFSETPRKTNSASTAKGVMGNGARGANVVVVVELVLTLVVTSVVATSVVVIVTVVDIVSGEFMLDG